MCTRQLEEGKWDIIEGRRKWSCGCYKKEVFDSYGELTLMDVQCKGSRRTVTLERGPSGLGMLLRSTGLDGVRIVDSCSEQTKSLVGSYIASINGRDMKGADHDTFVAALSSSSTVVVLEVFTDPQAPPLPTTGACQLQAPPLPTTGKEVFTDPPAPANKGEESRIVLFYRQLKGLELEFEVTKNFKVCNPSKNYDAMAQYLPVGTKTTVKEAYEIVKERLPSLNHLQWGAVIWGLMSDETRKKVH